MTDYLSLSLEINKLEEQLKETREKLQKALGVVGYYADIDSWHSLLTESIKYHRIGPEDIGDGTHDNGCGTDDSGVGGKRARDFLKEINNV